MFGAPGDLSAPHPPPPLIANRSSIIAFEYRNRAPTRTDGNSDASLRAVFSLIPRYRASSASVMSINIGNFQEIPLLLM